MITFTPPIDSHLTPARRTDRGFTLAEIMVAAAISTLVLVGVMGAFIFIGRAGFSTSGYSELEAQMRRGLDTFANDARMARGITWNNAQSITLALPTAGNGQTLVTYAYDSSTSGATPRCFYRLLGDANSPATRRVLVRDVNPDFSFSRFKLEQNGVTDNTASNDLETKLIQINLRAAKTGVTVGSTSQGSRSARYLLRNKRVTN